MSVTGPASVSFRLGLIGPRRGQKAPGGCNVAFDELVDVLQEMGGVRLEVIDSSLTGGAEGLPGKVRGLFRLARNLVRAARSCDVLGLHTTNRQLLLSVAVALGLCRIWRRPLVVRKFEGPNHRQRPPKYEDKDGLYAWMVEMLLRHADMLLVETHSALRTARESGLDNSEWFPNARRRTVVRPPREAGACSRFVFVGLVAPAKGIGELIEAGERLPAHCSVDVFGPLPGGGAARAFAPCRRVVYRGVLEPVDVAPTLARYDAFVLPTYWVGEGYPGAVVEALLADLPVISTLWQAIPELVDNTCGILVPPRDANALREAMLRLATDPFLGARLSAGAEKRAEALDLANWAGKYIDFCAGACRRRRLAAAA